MCLKLENKLIEMSRENNIMQLLEQMKNHKGSIVMCTDVTTYMIHFYAVVGGATEEIHVCIN